MSSAATKKRPSPEPDATEEEEPHTPFGSPAKKLKITQRQKQALINNLQLEITERARKLRAHYALQIQDLRSRLERRINRIPMALRRQTMGELLAKHEEGVRQAEAAAAAAAAAAVATTTTTTTSKKPAVKATNKAPETKPRSAPPSPRKDAPAVVKNVKRKSDEIHSSDKENAPFVDDNNHLPLANPKKRSKPNLAGGSSRAVSHVAASEITESRVLSPKSSNSRTFPQSPIRSPSKSRHDQFLSSRPSPLKLTSPLKAGMSEAGGTSRTNRGPAATSQKTLTLQNSSPASSPHMGTARRAPLSRPATRAQSRRASNSTVISNASNGTTIVRSTRTTAGTRKATKTAPSVATPSVAAKKAAVPRGQSSTASSAAKKVTTVRKTQGVEQSAQRRRVLRNRA